MEPYLNTVNFDIWKRLVEILLTKTTQIKPMLFNICTNRFLSLSLNSVPLKWIQIIWNKTESQGLLLKYEVTHIGWVEMIWMSNATGLNNISHTKTFVIVISCFYLLFSFSDIKTLDFKYFVACQRNHFVTNHNSHDSSKLPNKSGHFLSLCCNNGNLPMKILKMKIASPRPVM